MVQQLNIIKKKMINIPDVSYNDIQLKLLKDGQILENVNSLILIIIEGINSELY